jgi:hypothetical protein
MKSQQKRTPAKKQKQQASDMTDTITITSGASDVDVIDLGDTIDMSSWTIGSGGYGNITGSITVPTTTTWSQDYSITSAGYGNTFVSINSDGITMKEGTDIMIGGRKLGEVIAQIEDRLAILHPNEELESKWESLKELRRQYEALEKDILEKEKIMKILKEK